MSPCLIVLPLWLLVAIGLPAVSANGADDRTLADLLDTGDEPSPASDPSPTSNTEEGADLKSKVQFIKSMTSFLTSKAPMEPIKMEKMKQCGCESAAVPITWGNGVGAECVRLKEEDHPQHATCGPICMNKKGEHLSFFCPLGYEPACQTGCEPHKNMKVDEDPHYLLENLKLVIWILSKNLEPHMIEAFHTPMLEKKCGCAEKPTALDFGSRFGYQCIRHEEGHPQRLYEESCGVVCTDANNSQLILFCPPGWTRHCSEGCKWDFPDDEPPNESINKLAATLTGIMTHFKEAFPDPSVQSVIDCGCKSKPVSLGSITLGKTCERHEELDFDDSRCTALRCNTNQFNVDHVLFCPSGFKANCKTGCSLEFPHDEL